MAISDITLKSGWYQVFDDNGKKQLKNQHHLLVNYKVLPTHFLYSRKMVGLQFMMKSLIKL